MRRAAPFLVMAALLFAVGLLVLNLRERDLYLEGKTSPPPGPVNVDPMDGALSWLSPVSEHDGCVHRLELVENHRWMSLRDFDGWYRLFWAADDLYYFDDPSPFRQALGNSTARDAGGEWRIHARYVHDTCPKRPEIRALYRFSVLGAFEPEPPGEPVPAEIRWFRTLENAFVWKRIEFSWSE